MKTQGLPLSLRGIYLLCSAFITLWWFRVHVNPDIHCANVIFWIGPRTAYLALACDRMAAGTRLVGEPCYEYSLTCQDLLKEQTIPIETQCKVQLGVLCTWHRFGLLNLRFINFLWAGNDKSLLIKRVHMLHIGISTWFEQTYAKKLVSNYLSEVTFFYLRSLHNFAALTFFLSSFRVESESDSFRIHFSGYSGTAGNAMDNGHNLNNRPFTTIDRDNDGWVQEIFMLC